MTQEELDLFYMRKALKRAGIALKKNEVPVGAIIVKDGIVIARAENTREEKKNALCHAELSAINKACKKFGGWRLSGCTLYVTLEPCAMCYGAIINSRIDRVVFGAADKRFGCLGGMTDMSVLPFNHFPQITGDVAATECGNILSSFFKGLRNKK